MGHKISNNIICENNKGKGSKLYREIVQEYKVNQNFWKTINIYLFNYVSF
jgi:hypothetical protein